MSTTPVVSVIMPVYNGGLYLKEAIESILTQTYRNFEFIIVDDGSIDESLEILSGYQSKDNRLAIIRQDHLGVISALNKGLQKARGKYIARIDADDVALPDRLERQIKVMESSNQIVIIGSAYTTIDEVGAQIDVIHPPAADTLIRWQMLFYNCFANSSVMFRADTLFSNNLAYDFQAVQSEDYDLWSRLLEYGCAINLSIPLLRYRLHEGQASSINSDKVKEMSDWVSWKNIRRLQIPVSIEDVRVLRTWFYYFPRHLRQDDLQRCVLLLQIQKAFSLLPGMDLSICQKIKGYFLFRIIAASFPGQTKAVWQNCLSRYLGIRDMPSIFYAGIAKVFQMIHKQQFSTGRYG